MNINELDSFNLADAVKFHDRLNPRLWDRSEHLKPEVHAKLLEIAKDFQEFLGVPDLDVKDITVSGSNAAYNYTPTSDIDLHLVVDLPEADHSEVYRELFDAKKFQYNAQHNIRIGGYDVELYVQNPNEEHHSQGIYSLLKNAWTSVPKRRKAEIDDISTKSKYEDLAARIDSTVADGDHDSMALLMKKIKTMRKSGLEQNGEFGADNLAFKLLRNNGYIKKLVDARNAARDHELSLAELAKPKQKVTYGYVSESPDGVNPSTKNILEQPANESPDGVNPTTAMFLTEVNTESVVQDFINDTAKRLGIKQMPKILIHHDEDWSEENHSFGMYVPERHELHVSLSNRHLLDVLRTTAHELCHCAQHEIEPMPHHAGKTGSPWENEAHAVAGIIMRDFADAHPHYFQQDAIAESASGYIPKNKKEAKDPRFSMAVSVDVGPGQVGKEANKLALNTGKNGEPGLLMKTANLRESRMPQPSQGQGKYQDLNEPLGPEFKPTMPKGTVRVDVSDVYDWYKLGKHIPNLDRADASEFGKGPPSTIVSFGDEDTEHKYIKNLEKLGLTTTDIDPVDPNQPPGMKRQKVDPTYNVAEQALAESLSEELALFEEDLFEVKMTSKNLAQLAKAIPGATVGLEFEMIVPNVDGSDGGDMEPNYAEDERVRDIDDCVNFFDDGDYNDRSTIRRLRADMEEAYFEWKMEKIDELWNGNQGWEFFTEYLDREDPFDEEEAREEATNELQAQYGDDITPEEFEKMLTEIVNEKAANYTQEQWDDQGRNYDYAYDEFRDEQSDDISEEDWLDSQGIRYASDVESSYDVTWPYWDSPETETDSKEIALNFMNYMGYDTIAVGDYHGYGGGYQLWNGSEWVKIGSNKPMDAFTVEPDGSLSGDSSDDTGLEFVSPPIPLDQIGETMKKVQAWAGENGVYTGKRNSTSLHTNISIPGYDLDKLDYLKAAILLGDEHVLREFDRIGNTYAKPAIEKVKSLVNQKPEKAQELLDKMKSQLNAEASKLIHSGQTDKYTSINTKDNRIEFRSPGGDYLSIIADNPQKMIDTINRMVVVLDAAMDPNKYKEEYQKKLYKILTGQGGGREARTGAKQEMKASDKDLLNIFSRYAAGEMPKAALKSFVRQAQLERGVAKGKQSGKMWWRVSNPSHSHGEIEVVASSKEEAIDRALQQDGYPSWANTRSGIQAKPIRPFEEPKQPAAQPSSGQGNWGFWITSSGRFARMPGQTDNSVLRRFNSREEAQQFLANTPGVRSDIEIREIEPHAAAQDSGPTLNGRPSNPDGNYVITPEADRNSVYYRFMAAGFDDANAVRRQWAADNPGVWVVQRDDNRTLGQPPVPGSTLDLQRQRAAAAQEPATKTYELYDRNTGTVIDTFPARNDNEAMTRLNDFRDFSALARQNPQWDVGVRQQVSSRAQQPTTQFGANTGQPMYELVRNRDDEVVYRLFADDPDDAYEQASNFMIMQGWNPDDYSLQPAEETPSSEFRSTENVPREGRPRNLVPTGPGPWEIYRISDNSSVRELAHTNRAAAEEEARSALGLRGEAPELYGVRTRQQGDAAQGGIVDVAGEQPATGGSFTGEWKVVDPQGNEIYRFGGVGNAQSDANRVAMDWLRRNPRHLQAGVEVLPVMG